MKKGWEECSLNDYIKFIDYRGRTPVKTETGIRLITAKNVKVGYLQLEPQEFIAENDYDSWMSRGIPNYGDVIFTTEAPLGNVAQINTHEKLAFAQRIIVMQPQADKICQTFLKYLLISESVRKKIIDKGTGATVQGIKSSLLKKIQIPLPPLTEQKRIVAILDQAFEAIAKAKVNAEQNLKNAKELFESYLNEIFENKGEGWEEKKKLKEVCEKITDGTHQTPTYFESGYIFLSSKNVTSGKIDWKNVKYIDEKQHLEMYKRVSPKIGDILLAKNGTTGVAAMVDRDLVFNIYVSLAWLRSKGEVLPEFLLNFINSPIAKKQFNKRLKGTGVPNLHLEEIREVEISFPKSLEQQAQIVEKLDKLRAETQKLEAIYKQKIEDLEELKKSILQKAFAGELKTENDIAI